MEQNYGQSNVPVLEESNPSFGMSDPINIPQLPFSLQMAQSPTFPDNTNVFAYPANDFNFGGEYFPNHPGNWTDILNAPATNNFSFESNAMLNEYSEMTQMYPTQSSDGSPLDERRGSVPTSVSSLRDN